MQLLNKRYSYDKNKSIRLTVCLRSDLNQHLSIDMAGVQNACLPSVR